MNLSTSRTLWLSLLTMGFLACDRIGQDMAPTDTTSDDTELFALPDNKIAVDLTTFANLQTATTFKIKQQPQSGTLSFAANGLLLYAPNQDFVAGDDDFSVSAMRQGVDVPMPLTVKMAADEDDIPCQAGALPDRADTPIGQPVIVEVLKNDRVCDGSINPTTLRVVVKPKAGTVRIDGETIVYTPTSTTFSGHDEFVYRICSDGGSSAKCYVAPVSVMVGGQSKDCHVTLNDDQVNYRQVFVTDSLIIPVLANDQLCQSNRQSPITITKAPTKGVAYTQTRSSLQAIIYKPTVGTDGTDNLTYQRCESGTCLQATVRLQAKAVAATCRLVTRSDQRTASLSSDWDAKTGKVFIPVLLNDDICSPIATMRIVENASGLNLKVRNGVILYTLGNMPQKGTHTFTYELIDLKNNRASAQVKVILNE